MTTNQNLRADAEEFHRALAELLRVYQFRDRETICCYEISVTQCYALEALVQRGPMKLNDLAAALYLDKSTTSRVVTTLEEKGYIRRDRHPEDGRAVVIEATASGRKVHDRIENDIVSGEQTLLAGFSPEVRRGIIRVLQRVAAVAGDRVETGGGSCCSIA